MTALCQSLESLACALERLHLRHELAFVDLAFGCSEPLLNLDRDVGKQARHQIVPALPDLRVDLGAAERIALRCESPVPCLDMRVVAIDQGAIDVEENCALLHGPANEHRSRRLHLEACSGT